MAELTHKYTAELILQRLVNEGPDWFGDTPVADTLARAQVHATLALVDALNAGNKRYPEDF